MEIAKQFPWYAKYGQPERDFVILCGFGVLLILFAATRNNYDGGKYQLSAGNPDRSYSRTETRSATDDEISAWTMAQSIITKHLKAPSTASFGNAFGEYQNPSDCVRNSGGSYLVSGWVDSENSFGAMLRTRWEVELEKGPAADSWRIVRGPDFDER